MKNEKCPKFFPKKFQDKTIVDQDGFTIYCRRANGAHIEKSGVTLDDRHVVP